MNEQRTKWTGFLAGWRARHLLAPERQVQAAELLRWAALEVPPGACALDLGAGTGLLTLPLARRLDGGRVIALDLSPELLEQLGGRAVAAGFAERIELRRAPADATGLPDASVDLAVSAMLLHEVPDPRAVLAELYRVLRPGAPLLLRDFRSGRLSWVARLHHPRSAYGHLGEEELIAAISDAGLELLRHRRVGRQQDAVARKPAS